MPVDVVCMGLILILWPLIQGLGPDFCARYKFMYYYYYYYMNCQQVCMRSRIESLTTNLFY
jgi:hypothetical protein